jgi:phage tail sheath protein FI
MAVQVSYPGVYIEEFTPGAPIQGVGTNTAAFIGTATRGPIEAPTLIQSWDAFESRFGGFIAEQPTSYLAPAVYGFFLNGGTACYIVRAGTGKMASADLDSRQGGGSPEPILVARALEEGPGGNAISIRVVDNSLLTSLLGKAGASDVDLPLWRAEADISAISEPDRRQLTVSDNRGFAPGDRILLTKNADTATAIVNATRGTDTLVLMAPVAGTVDFADGAVRTADLTQGQRTVRLAVPDNLRLNQALPRGATVSITLGGTGEIRTVESSGGDTITLTEGLANSYSMEDEDTLPRVASLEFDLFVDDGGNIEIFELLSMHPDHPNYWRGAVESELVTITEPDEPPDPTPADPRPAAATYNLAGGTADDRLAARAALIANPNDYLDLLKPYDDVALVCVPGATEAAVQQAMIAHCEAMYDRFAILDSIRGATPGNGIRDQFADVRSERGFAALYYPWILARNPLTGRDELWPPSGHITGVYARTDAQRGVHKAPANTNIRGALGLERLLTNEEQGPLNLMGINVLRVFPEQAQPVVWGARTTATDRNWQYVNVRRLFLFLEESIEEGIRWAVFEPNNLQLWQKLKRTITEFLTRVWQDGALFGATPKEAFYVRIDEVLNPPSTQALGRLYIEIGVRPAYPAEFIIVRIGIWQGDSDVSEG